MATASFLKFRKPFMNAFLFIFRFLIFITRTVEAILFSFLSLSMIFHCPPTLVILSSSLFLVAIFLVSLPFLVVCLDERITLFSPLKDLFLAWMQLL